MDEGRLPLDQGHWPPGDPRIGLRRHIEAVSAGRDDGSIAAWRLDLAAEHLRAGTEPIGEIAAIVGYGSGAALTRAFKAQFGTAPARFRKAGAAASATE